MSEKISAGGCDYHAEHGCASLREEWHRAGNTIRALQEQPDAANVRAEEAEQALEALRAETAPLVEIERCKASITVADLADRLVTAKTRERKSKRYLDDLRWRLGRFCCAFGDRLAADVTTEELST